MKIIHNALGDTPIKDPVIVVWDTNAYTGNNTSVTNMDCLYYIYERITLVSHPDSRG